MKTEKQFTLRFATDEASRCLMCYDAACSNACPVDKKPDKLLRSIRFDNIDGAAHSVSSHNYALSCSDCVRPCENVCSLGKINDPIQIGRVLSFAENYSEQHDFKGYSENEDLSIDFCGIKCENPFFLSSSIVASNYEMVSKAFKMGWGGAVFKTIGKFVPKEVSPRFDVLRRGSTSFVGLKNLEQISDHSLSENLAFLRMLKNDFPNKVIVASIMGRSEEEWEELAGLVTADGKANIVECNFSCPHMASHTLGSDVGQNPELVQRFTAAAKRGTKAPVLAKMTPNLADMLPPAEAAVRGGADGIAAINTVKSILNIDIEDCTASPSINGKSSVSGYSGKAVKPIALRFISDMASDPCLRHVPLSGMGGIETWRDALEFILLGCTNVQVTTSVMQYGYRIIDDLKEGISLFMQKTGTKHLSELVGRAVGNIVDSDKLDRNTICYPIINKKLCVGCGRCFISCYDAGHQAILWDEKTKRPVLLGARCAGCQLCGLVCSAGAISKGNRVSSRSI